MGRRLTVTACPTDLLAGKGGGKGSRDSGGTKDLRKDYGFDEVFKAAEGKRAILIVSRTDDDKEKKRKFEKKDEHVFISSVGEEEQESTKKWLESMVGWTCNKGLKPDSPNQDCLSILVVEDNFALYGVYDGHGPYGHDISEFACKHLPKRFLQERQQEGQTVPGAFMEAFADTQRSIARLNKDNTLKAEMSGTTCTMAFHCIKTQKLTVAHVGDSRSVIGNGKSVMPLTQDHKPDLPAEKARIESANPPGRVVFDGFFNYRVFTNGELRPGLNMSRALGDVFAHNQAGLTAVPDIKEFDLKQVYQETDDRVLLLCTDGVWEFIDDDMAVKCCLDAAKKAPMTRYCKDGIEKLATMGYDKWMHDSEYEISDDITGIMVRLPPRRAVA